MVCCKWSCIMSRAFVTRSSDICSDMDGVVAEESSRAFQAPFQPCFHRLVRELLLLTVARERQACASTGAPHAPDGLERKGGWQIVAD